MNETASYRPKWQDGDKCEATLPTQFIREEEGHHVEYAMARDVVLDEYSTQKKILPHPTSFTEASGKKVHLAKIHQVVPV